jgi:hypothetical protein
MRCQIFLAAEVVAILSVKVFKVPLDSHRAHKSAGNRHPLFMVNRLSRPNLDKRGDGRT